MLIYQLHQISWLLFSRSQTSHICVTTVVSVLLEAMFVLLIVGAVQHIDRVVGIAAS